MLHILLVKAADISLIPLSLFQFREYKLIAFIRVQ